MTDHRATWTALSLDDTATEPYTDTPDSQTFTVEQGRFTAGRTGRYQLSCPLPSAHYIVDVTAPPNSCSRCGELERGHGEQHPYVAPDNVLRLARMKARRQDRLNPPRAIRLAPETLVSFAVDLSGFTAAIEGAIEAMRPPPEAFEYEYAETVYETDASPYLVRASATGRRTSIRLSPDATPALDWGAPLDVFDKDWHEQGSTCAHICGPDPDHQCDARAATSLKYKLPSGGTRTMPICGPCNASEGAAKETADA